VYNWLVFIHIAGVLGFLGAHGVSMSVSFRLRRERDAARVNELLAFSASSTQVMYVSLVVLLLAGIAAGFKGHWWGQAWIWISIAALVVATLVMYAVAKPYYTRVRLVAKARAGGSRAVSDEQWDSVLRSGRVDAVAAIGIIALGLILYMMIFKPTFTSAAVTPVVVPSSSNGSAPATLPLAAKGLKFTTSSLTAPANAPFTIAFDNQDPGVQHNVAIYTDSSFSHTLFRGALVTGPTTTRYSIPALPPGTYVFHCDVHPPMTGTLVVK
jgi:plastocyanin